jgi:hypothetical protein
MESLMGDVDIAKFVMGKHAFHIPINLIAQKTDGAKVAVVFNPRKIKIFCSHLLPRRVVDISQSSNFNGAANTGLTVASVKGRRITIAFP